MAFALRVRLVTLARYLSSSRIWRARAHSEEVILRGSATPSMAEVVISFREPVRRFFSMFGDIFHILLSACVAVGVDGDVGEASG